MKYLLRQGRLEPSKENYFALRKERKANPVHLYFLKLFGVVYPLTFVMDDPALLGEYIQNVFAC